MSWEYRVVKRVIAGVPWYAIHEVYYEADGRTVEFWTSDPVAVGGDDTIELENDLDRYRAALGKPILEAKDLPRGSDKCEF